MCRKLAAGGLLQEERLQTIVALFVRSLQEIKLPVAIVDEIAALVLVRDVLCWPVPARRHVWSYNLRLMRIHGMR